MALKLYDHLRDDDVIYVSHENEVCILHVYYDEMMTLKKCHVIISSMIEFQ